MSYVDLVDYENEGPLHVMFMNQAKRTPNKVAVYDHDGRTITFQELDYRTDILAKYLINNGFQRGSALGVLMERSLEWVISYIAAHKAGGAYLPLETSYPEALLESVLDDAKPFIVVTKENYIPRLEKLSVMKIQLEGDWMASLTEEGYLPDLVLPKVELDDLAYVVYSSGTTGKPKGILCPHRGAVHAYKWRHKAYPYEADDREACNIFFVWEMLRPLIKGIPMYIISDTDIYDPPRVTKFIEKNKITRILFTPSLLETIITYKGIDIERYFKTLKIIIFCGEVVTTSVRDQIATLCPWIQLLNLYSISETHDVSCADISNPNGSKEGRQYCSVGKALPFVHVLTFDENFNIKKIGEPGFIYIGGPGLAIGYLNLPELNRKKFIETPDQLKKQYGTRLYNTGDWGFALSDGSFEIIGRSDTMVKIRGYTVELQAIEVVLREFSKVESCCVLCVGEEGQNKVLVAYIVSTELIKPSALRSCLKTKLPFYMIPSKYFFLDSLPILSSSGKLNKKELPMFKEYGEIELDESMNLIERKIATLWCRILNLYTIEKDENFFEIGGHSLTAAQCIGQMNDQFSCNLSMSELFSHPSVQSMASLLENRANHSEFVNIQSEIENNAFKNKDASLNGRVQLFWKSIQMNNSKLGRGNVLLTGTPGFLGMHLLEKLLTQTRCVIFLTIRETPNETISDRIVNSLTKYKINLNIDNYEDRLIYLKSDLSLENLGLKNREEYDTLSQEIDMIIHAAAYVNLILPYSALYRSNVLATKHLIEFSLLNKIKYFNYISTDSVFPLTGEHYTENVDAPKYEEYLNQACGYGQSKGVAESLVLNAQKHGLPFSIVRCGNIGGSLKYQNWNFTDFNLFMLQGIIASEFAPDVNWNLEFTPVDFLTKSLVRLYTNITHSNKIYNFVNSKPIHIKNIITLLNTVGYNIKSIPYENWLEQIKSLSMSQLSMHLLNGNGKVLLNTNNTFCTKNTTEFLKSINESYPITDEQLFEQCLSNLETLKLIPCLNQTAQLINPTTHDRNLSIEKNSSTVNITFENNIRNKIVFITGCSSGIGEELVKDLVLMGAKVVAVARRIDRLRKLKFSLGDKAKNVVIKELDVTIEKDVKKSVDEVIEEYGHIDILVNNAGVMYFTLVQKYTLNEWNKMVDVNIKGILYCTGNILPKMIQSGRSGHVINISSNAGVRPFAGLAVYTGTKYFVEGFSGALRQEVSGHDIRVTCIQPGDIKTELINYSTDKEVLDKYNISNSGIPLLTTKDISKTIIFTLLQPHNSVINGVLIEPPLASI